MCDIQSSRFSVAKCSHFVTKVISIFFYQILTIVANYIYCVKINYGVYGAAYDKLITGNAKKHFDKRLTFASCITSV